MQLPSTQSAVGRAIRLPLRLVPRGHVVPILSGPLRGARWVVGNGNHGYWLGTYERHVQSVLLRYVKRGTAALDLGAHYGFYTLLMARLVGRDGRVIAFEPTPPNAAKLRRHVALNPRLAPRITIVERAIGRINGEATIAYQGERASSGASILPVSATSMTYTVPISSLDSLSLPPWISLIKIDVEWAEAEVLRGAQRLLSASDRRPTALAKRPVLVVACHSSALYQDVTAVLESYGYRTEATTPGRRNVEGAAEILALPR